MCEEGLTEVCGVLKLLEHSAVELKPVKAAPLREERPKT